MRYLIYILLLVSVAGCSNYQKIVKDGTPQEKLDAARKYYKNKDYIRAQPLLEELLGLYYGKKEREEIYYLFAYSYYGDGQYLLAGYYFNSFTQNYALSPKKEEASFMSALCKFKRSMPYELDQTPTKDAITSLQTFINQYPNSVYVNQCNEKIDILRSQMLKKVYESAKLYHSLGYFKSAMVSCSNAIEDYPDMINREELSFLIVESAFLYAENSVAKKQKERYQNTLIKLEEFNKEYRGSASYSKRIQKIEEKTKLALAQLT